jgi:hypothetical protein
MLRLFFKLEKENLESKPDKRKRDNTGVVYKYANVCGSRTKL